MRADDSVRTLPPLHDEETETLPPQELLTIAASAPVIHKGRGTTVVHISPGRVLKSSTASSLAEAEMAMIVRQTSSVFVPAIYRAWLEKLQYGNSRAHIVMEYVDGRILEGIWCGLDPETRAAVIDAIVDVVRRLQSARIEEAWHEHNWLERRRVIQCDDPPMKHSEPCHVTGPVGGSYEGFLFSSDIIVPTYKDRDAFRSFFNQKFQSQLQEEPPDVYKRFQRFRFSRFVVTHCDLRMWNMVWQQQPGENGRLFLLDYDLSGIYPAAFELALIKIQLKYAQYQCDPHIDYYEDLVAALEYPDTDVDSLVKYHSLQCCQIVLDDEIYPDAELRDSDSGSDESSGVQGSGSSNADQHASLSTSSPATSMTSAEDAGEICSDGSDDNEDHTHLDTTFDKAFPALVQTKTSSDQARYRSAWGAA